MYRPLARTVLLLLACALFSGVLLNASDIPVGILSLDNTNGLEPTTAQFDITNLTGANALAPDFPVTTSLNFSITSLVINFMTGPSETLLASDFTSDGSGGFLGNNTFNLATSPILSAFLTGTFNPTTGIPDVLGGTILPDFTTTLTDVLGPLQTGDAALISVTPASTSPVPEPGTWVLMGTGVLFMLLFGSKQLLRLQAGRGLVQAALLVSVCILGQSAAWAVSPGVTLTTAAQPPSGIAGTSTSYVTGVGFPSGVLPPAVTVSFAPTCLATPSATTIASSVKKVVGSTDRVGFTIPGTLPTGTYAVWVDGGSPLFFHSTTCSTLGVTGSSSKVSACIPSSSLAVSLGSTVTAYIPHGNWISAVTGIGIVNIEGAAGSATIATPNVVNACSSNSVTGQTVCTANNTDVYLITGTTLNRTLTSGATTTASFSGGSCYNCGVAIDAANNTAYIEEGVIGGAYNDGVQALNLATNTFSSPYPMQFRVSENIAIDPNLNYILSPGEDANYTLLQIAPSGVLSEFGNAVSELWLDSAAEDCTTGIALASSEFTSDIYIQDLTQAVFTPGTPGSYTAPGQFQTLNGSTFSAGTSGISVAPGSSHLAVVTGEFGGSTFAVLQLPATSGIGTPSLVDYAFTLVPANPAGGSSPCAGGFNAGLDPHTLTAYTSSNDGKAYALFSDSATCLVRVDMAAVLAAPRVAGTKSVTTPPASAYTYYAVP